MVLMRRRAGGHHTRGSLSSPSYLFVGKETVASSKVELTGAGLTESYYGSVSQGHLRCLEIFVLFWGLGIEYLLLDHLNPDPVCVVCVCVCVCVCVRTVRQL